MASFNFNTLDNTHVISNDQTEYLRFCFDLIKASEGVKPAAYLDSKGIPTIGIGFNLRDEGVLQKVMTAFGVTEANLAGVTNEILTIAKAPYTSDTALQTALNNQMAQYYAQSKVNRPTFAFAAGETGLTEMRNTFNEAVQEYEGYHLPGQLSVSGRVDNWLADIPPSKERAVLVSLSYNGLINKTTSPTLRKAILDGNRSEAWFQIRYDSNKLGKYHINSIIMKDDEQKAYNKGEDYGIAKRRFLESETFGLYNDDTSVTSDEANSVYRMLQLHRDYILKYEASYGQTADGQNGDRGNQIDKANSHYHLTGNNVVETLLQALTPARDILISDLKAKYPGLAGIDLSSYGPLSIYLDPNRNNASQTIDGQHNAKLDARHKDQNGNEIASNDILIGEDGSDTLTGGLGDDILIGGKGNDIYVWNTGDGSDTIIDEDKGGVIQINGGADQQLFVGGAFVETSPGVWQQTIGSSTITVTHHSPWRVITEDGSEIILGDDWQSGDFGIFTVSPQSADTNFTIVGDFKPLDQDSNADGIQLGYDALGNLVTDPDQSDFDRQDTLYDSTGNDNLQGLGGDDILEAIRGGDDLLEGGSGSDILNGGSGNDLLYAEAEISVLQALAQADSQAATGLHGDWLYGGEGDDTLLGEGSNDLMLGGNGADLILGGGGDDNLFGDQTGSASQGWDVSRSTTTSNNHTIYSLAYTNANAEGNPIGGADILYGGAGNDWMFGNQGRDMLDGGVGTDVLFGGEDGDTLLGRDGDDELYGNAGVDSPLNDGNDYLDGGAGNDKLLGGGGSDVLFGGLGDDILAGDHNGTLEADEGEDYLDGGDGSDTLHGGGKNDTLLGGAGMDYLFGESGDDLIFGGADDDQLRGDAGGDYLDGGDGNDIVDGGEGNDTLLGGAGADILQGGNEDDIYQDVTAEDTVYDILGNNLIQLNQAGGLAYDNALSKGDQYGVDLNIALDNGETITFSNALYGMNATLVFAGGNELDLEALVGHQLSSAVSLQLDDSGGRLYGGAGADSLYGGSGNDTLSGALGADKLYGQAGIDLLIGGDGNDILYGGEGDDSLIGGAGQDLLLGGSGDDFYQLTSAADNSKIADTQGQNLIKFGNDIDPNQLTASVSTLAGQTALSLTLADVELVTITQGYNSFDFEFADGKRLTLDDFLLNYRTGTGTGNVYGTGNDDSLLGGQTADNLYGYAGNDNVWGGRGDDVLAGGLGSDDYRYRLGDGHDIIVETDDANLSGQDRVSFGAGITSSDVVFNRRPNGDLSVTVAYLADAITITGWFNDATSRVETFAFADGETITAETLLGLAIAPQTGGAGNDTLTGSGYRDIILAGAGDDVLTGNGGDDDLYGEAGTDTYRFTLGSGADQVFEVSGETTTLEVSGFDLSRLTSIRLGDDLLLSVSGASDSMRLKNFYDMPHSWQVSGNGGGSRDLIAVLADNEAYRTSRSELGRLQDELLANIADQANHLFREAGMLQQADGSWMSALNIAVSKQTNTYARADGYTGSMPTDSSAYQLNGYGLTFGGVEVLSYDSDAAVIEMV